MTLAETVSQIAVAAMEALLPLVVAAFGAFCVKATMWVHAHSKNNLVLAMTDRVEVEAKAAVAAGAQTVADDLKAKATNGKLSQADAEKIKADVLAQLTANLGGDKWLALAQTTLGVSDIKAYLATKVEAAVQELNAARPVPVTVVTTAKSALTPTKF